MYDPRKQSRTIPFVSGLILGILGMIFLPGYVKPYLPQWAGGETIAVKGTVTAKQRMEKTVLLAVNMPEGVLLATFKKKVDEINLLVNEKDTIELTVEKYAPFIDDPKIIWVGKEEPAPPVQVPEVKPKEKNAKEVKPKRQEKLLVAPPAPAAAEKKPQPASPAPSTTEVKPPAGSPAPGAAETKQSEPK